MDGVLYEECFVCFLIKIQLEINIKKHLKSPTFHFQLFDTLLVVSLLCMILLLALLPGYKQLEHRNNTASGRESCQDSRRSGYKLPLVKRDNVFHGDLWTKT